MCRERVVCADVVFVRVARSTYRKGCAWQVDFFSPLQLFEVCAGVELLRLLERNPSRLDDGLDGLPLPHRVQSRASAVYAV